MRQIVVIGIFILYSSSILGQSGNVGIGTNDPQAKLHISGDVRVDDKVEIKNSDGGTVFLLDPENYTFDILDSLGNVFYRFAANQDTSANLKGNNSADSRAMNSLPQVVVEKQQNGVTKTTTRRPDGTVGKVEEMTGAGGFITEFHSDGTTASKTVAYFPAFGFISNKFFNENGDLTHEEEIGTNGSYAEVFYYPNGQIKSEFEREPAGSDKSIKKHFDSNGNLLFSEEYANGVTQVFNENSLLIKELDFQTNASHKVFEPFTGGILEYNGLSSKLTKADGTVFTEVEAGIIGIGVDDKHLNLNQDGFNAFDALMDLFFYCDAFGISKFEGPDFVGLDFNAPGGNIDAFADFNVFGTISKTAGTFKIDHPLDPKNKFLYHSFVESPDMMNIYNGNVTTNKEGEALVELPSYFEALNIDFRYQLTVIGSFAQAVVWKKVENNQFTIKTDAPNVEVSWQVTGVRNDSFAKDNRVQVEVDKKGYDKGKLIYNPENSIPYSQNLRAKQQRLLQAKN